MALAPSRVTLERLHQPGTVLLDTARSDKGSARSLLFSNPVRILKAEQPGEIVPLLDELDAALIDGYHAAGFLAYEAATAFLPVKLEQQGSLLGWFGIYEAPLFLSPGEVGQVFSESRGIGHITTDPLFSHGREGYARKIAAVQHHIREGDVYQINFTGRFRFSYEGSPLALYRFLRERQRVPYAAYVDTGDRQVLSFSPELFFRREGERITTQPMKGTARRGSTLAEDEQLARWLATDAKSRAENLMIVDLLRNDLSVVCRTGSVHVPELFATHFLETLIQMTSTVEGQLRPGVGLSDIMRALFPCGSVTGAPKIRSMQLIRTLEEGLRSVYCGAIGYAGPDERAVFNVAIRTIELQEGRGCMGVGSGIVSDSEADSEYEECLLKGRFLTSASRPDRDNTALDFQLIETMRWQGGIPLLKLHLTRLGNSARYFDIPYDEQTVRAYVEQRVNDLSGSDVLKVRLTLSKVGQIQITVSEAIVPPSSPLRVRISPERVDSGDVFLYHKTTHRETYEEEYRQARSEEYDEVLFLNERGEVTEGSRTNIFIRNGNELFTPPISSGLLPGVYRRHLLETHPGARERVLYPEDLRTADVVFVCNAVWGMVEVRLDFDRVRTN